MSGANRSTPWQLLWESFRALLPTLTFDVAGTMIVYYLLLRYFSTSSIWPLIGASLVPALSNIFNFVRRHTPDIIGLLILVGLVGGIAGAVSGGSQRLLLLRESFVSALTGIALLVSVFVARRPIGYYVIREFLTANEALGHEHFDIVWQHRPFRRGVRIVTLSWGALLVGEFVLRAFMALNMNVAFVLGVAPVLFIILMLLAGSATAVWLTRAISAALRANALDGAGNA